jgi:cysteinyl-tRNA synthetase
MPYLSRIFPIEFYNSLSGEKEKFKPISENTVKMYTCGPTVYNFAHIGNLRTYIFEDILRRNIKANGYNIFQVMNITDIDDKIIKESLSSGKDFKKIASFFEQEFFKDLDRLNIEKPEKTPRATEHINKMISLIQKLIDKGYAYESDEGSVYFNLSKFKDYGKLSHPDLSNSKSAERINADEYEKNEAKDFVLWKAKKEGEPSWESPWGVGRPGWHIECSAMSMKYLGESFDIHTGGVDNIFPHHENEIAQSEAVTKKPLARYWLHGEHLLVDGKKMAKSADNFYTLSDMEKRGFDPLSFRYLCLQTHYRSKMNFTWESLGAAQTALEGLRKVYISSKQDYESGNKKKRIFSRKLNNIKKNIAEALNDDLNTPRALATLWTSLKEKGLFPAEKLSLIEFADKVLGLNLKEGIVIMEIIPDKLVRMVKEREKMREQGQFKKADQIRLQIEEKGYEVRDDKSGYKIIKR